MNKQKDTTTIQASYQYHNANADLEELILAYVFFYIKPEYFQLVLEIVNEHHFFFRENKIVFLALKEALKQDTPLHPKTIRYLLKPSDFMGFGDPESDFNNGLEKYFTKMMSNVELGVFHLDIEKLCLKLKDLSFRRGITNLLNEGQIQINNPKKSTNDVSDYLTTTLSNISQLQFSDKKNDDLDSIISNVFTNLKLSHLSESKGILPSEGVPTGLKALDDALFGFRNSDMILIGARPSMGKTALVTTMALSIAKILAERKLRNLLTDCKKTLSKESILFFSLEMSSSQIGERLIALEANVNLSKMIKGRLRNEDFQAIEKCLQATNNMKDLSIDIDSKCGNSIRDIRRRVSQVVMSKGVALVIVDYLQLIKHDTGYGKNGNRVQEVTAISSALKGIARDFNIPVIALSQLSRNSEGRECKIPRLSDLRDSGSLEQDADIVLLLHREEYYLERETPTNSDDPTTVWFQRMEKCRDTASIIIAKHRNGAVGAIKMGFDKESMKFYDLDQKSKNDKFI